MPLALPPLKVAVLTNVRDVASYTSSKLRALGLQPVGVVAARRRVPDRELGPDGVARELHGVPLQIAASRAEIEPVLGFLQPDLVLSWAFPWLVPPGALTVAPLGAINYHPSLLPRHRGPNPIAWTVRTGDSEYGVTWHRMSPEFDSGPILAQRSTPAGPEDATQDVIVRLSTLGLRMLGGALRRVADGEPGDPQRLEDSTEAPVFGEDYAMIDWSKSARQVHDQVRAWSFNVGGRAGGPFGCVAGVHSRVLRTSLSEPAAGAGRACATRVECADGPIWVLEHEAAPEQGRS